MASVPKNSSSLIIFNLILRGPSATRGVMKSLANRGRRSAIAATLKLKKGDHIFLVTLIGPSCEMRWAYFSGSLLEAEP